MADQQDYERFDVDNDYEGGEWIGGEFYFRNKRQKRQQTEDDRIYGVFAEGSDSDDDRRSRRKGGERSDYTKPVGFVSSGVVNQNPEAQDQERPGLGAEGPKEEQQEPRRRTGTSSGGLGFKSTGQQKPDKDEDDEAEDGVLATAFGARIKQRVNERRTAEQKEHRTEKQRAATRASDPQFGAFEKFTKGIGMKLLAKMGYKPGEGLGRDRSGIAKPVEAKLRPKGMALGFGVRHVEEEMEQERARAKAEGAGAASEAGALGAAQPQQRLWKKKNQEARARREYRTADQVLADSGHKPPTLQPIIDMRGPQTRIITNLEHLHVKDESAAGDKTPMPELQHNLQLLVDLCEAELQKLDAQLRHEQDTATLLARDKARLEAEAEEHAARMERLQHVMTQVASCQEAYAAAAAGAAGFSASARAPRPVPLTLDQVEAVYSRLAEQYREEYILYNLAAAALAQALPRLNSLMRGWVPLSEPRRGVPEFTRWRPLLESPNAGGPLGGYGGDVAGGASSLLGGSEDPYLLLVSEVVLPPLRSAVTSQWQPRDPEPLLSWLEAWEGLLPGAALSHVLDMLVMPKLRQAVQEWEPRMETVPVHAWLHPWLPYLGVQLEEVYPGIRHKLSIALQMWHPSDGSALALLRPWHKVFSPGDWDNLLLKCILPKLAFALQQLVIDPTNQDMSPFLWVTAWQEVVPLQQMVSLLELHFFPKWHQVLHYWLQHSPNYDEVTRWYLGWKTYFPPALLDQERIRRQFTAALDAMNSAVEGKPVDASAGAAPFHSRWSTDAAAAGADSAAGAGAAARGAFGGAGMAPAPPAASELTLKDLVQRFAEEHSISFMPKFGRFHDGLQVYSFGGVSIVLENTQNVIRAQIRDRWAPVSLDTLLQQAATAK